MPTTEYCTTWVSDLTKPGAFYYRATAQQGNVLAVAELKQSTVHTDGRYGFTVHAFHVKGAALGRKQQELAEELKAEATCLLQEAARLAGWRTVEVLYIGRYRAFYYPPVEVAPVEPAPVEVAPVEPAPVEVAPVEPAPVEPCSWCGGNGAKSDMQPAFCLDCVQAMLRGEEDTRRDLYQGNPVEPAPVEPAPVEPAPVKVSPRSKQSKGGKRPPLTLGLSDEDWRQLEQELAAQEEWGKRFDDKHGFTSPPVSVEQLALYLLRDALRIRSEWQGRKGGA